MVEDQIGLAFERRIQDEVERAKRFNLGLSLIVIDAEQRNVERGASIPELLVDAVRPELRASDLLGQVRGGALAVLLVHTGVEGAESVSSRLRQRLRAFVSSTQLAAIRLGQAVFSADCQTGDALIQQALRRRAGLSTSR
jgi:hypothetical protein